MVRKIRLAVVVLGFFMTGLVGYSHADGVLSGLNYSFSIQGDMSIVLNNEASILVTLANGDIVIADSQDQVPADLTGATIDVFRGCVTATGGNSVQVCIGEKNGEAKALTGSTNVKTKEGVDDVLAEGDQYPLIGDEIAPATAASGENLGGPASGFAPFDSTSADNRDNPVSPSSA